MEKMIVVKSQHAPKDRDVLWINPIDKSINIFDSSEGWVNMLATEE